MSSYHNRMIDATVTRGMLIFCDHRKAHELAREADAEIEGLRKERDELDKYFKLTEQARGAQHYAADALLEHFSVDEVGHVELKGNGNWRIADIYKWIQKFISAENAISEQVNFQAAAIDVAKGGDDANRR